MNKLIEIILQNPLQLIKWGYEFPILTDLEFSFEVKTKSYCGRIKIEKKEFGYCLILDKTNKQIQFETPNKIMEILTRLLLEEDKSILPFD